MHYATIDECFDEIQHYCANESIGYSLIVNTENYSTYREIIQRLSADASKHCKYAYDYCFPNGLPNPSVYPNILKQQDDLPIVLIGVSSVLLLLGKEYMQQCLSSIISSSGNKKSIVVLEHCEELLLRKMYVDPRTANRIVMVEGKRSAFPNIKLIGKKEEYFGIKPLDDIQELQKNLIKVEWLDAGDNTTIPVRTDVGVGLFEHSCYYISASKGPFEVLQNMYIDIRNSCTIDMGTDKQWNWLGQQLQGRACLADYISYYYGSTNGLATYIGKAIYVDGENDNWLLWLGLKLYGAGNNTYLKTVLSNSQSPEDLEKHIYFDLLDIDCHDQDFKIVYAQRKHLLENLQENMPIVKQYCSQVGQKERNAVYYLTDVSSYEAVELIKCLCTYEYKADELQEILAMSNGKLASYMHKYSFNSTNTKVASKDIAMLDELTDYFEEYKLQKLTNKVHASFVEKVELYANTRPYNKLQPRSLVISHIQGKDKFGLFFFDALGVEYLAFIQNRCEKMGMVAEISIAHCELPSITCMNKEFLKYFKGYFKIDELDEMKHHSKDFDYQKVKEPIHLLDELDIIDKELAKIHAQLSLGMIDKALIVSDHGASRLAVIYEHESNSPLELDTKGEHSGRCCPATEDPGIEHAAFENNYSILANYDRFKGGRKANVEVHGGATLEEVCVPIISLSMIPEEISYAFVEPVVTYKIGVPVVLVLFCNVPMKSPRIKVNDKFYDGAFIEDKKHAHFTLLDIKRSKEYTAELYEEDKNLGISLKFTLQRKVAKEKDLF